MKNQELKINKKQYCDLVEELNYLQTIKEKEIAKKIKKARNLGDLSENSKYDNAKNKQKKLYARVDEIKNIINNAEVFHPIQPVLKCRSFEDIMQDYTAKTALPERLEDGLPEEIKYFMRRLTGHELSNICCFGKEIDRNYLLSGSSYECEIIASAYGGEYWFLESDSKVSLIADVIDITEEDGPVEYDIDIRPLEISFSQFVIAVDLYAQYEKVVTQYKDNDISAADDHDDYDTKCPEKCKFCELRQELRYNLLSIDKSLAKNWPY